MTLSQKPRWPLILSMKSASERHCRRRKSGGQTGRGKQDIANEACFDLSTQASQIMPSNSAFITLHMFIQHQLYARHYARAVKRTCMAKELTSFRVCVCVCVCVCVHACVHTGSVFTALSLGFFMEYLTSWMPVLCAAWVHVFLGCFPFLHGSFLLCILVSS